MTSAVFAEKKSAGAASRAKAASKAASSNLRIGPPNDYFEQEADRVADQVMAGGTKRDWSFSRMSIDPPLRRKCSCGGSGGADGQCEECKEKEQKTLQRKAADAVESDVAPPIVHEVLDSPGQPLDQATRNFFEPRFGYDFSNVRIHSDSRAAESARAINALAYTVGHDVALESSQYAPRTDWGRRLLAHELTHVVQQRGTATSRDYLPVQRTRRVQIGTGRAARTLVVGSVEFTSTSKQDLVNYGSLLPGPDQAHIGWDGNLLGYEEGFTNPADPFRWNKLKFLIDSDQPVLIKKVSVGDQIDVGILRGTNLTVTQDMMKEAGLTLLTSTFARKTQPNAPLLVVSPFAGKHLVYYTNLANTPAQNSMAHEMFGHLWLGEQGVPSAHPKSPAGIQAFGTLTAAHGVLDPFGNVYTGTVKDFIDKYVSSQFGALSSPTQNVGPALLQSALTTFKQGFKARARGTMNGAYSVPSDVSTAWEAISQNYALAPAQAPAAQTTPPTTTPGTGSGSTGTPATPTQQTTPPATTGGGGSAAPATPAVSQASIESDITAWYGALSANQQYVFFRLLNDVMSTFTRKSELAAQLHKTLTPPKGMNTP